MTDAADAAATDAGQPDTAVPLCDCGSKELSLACVCAQQITGCDTFEEALAKVSCPGFPGRPSLRQGCGYKEVNLSSGGLSSRTYVYQGTNNRLVGALLYIDMPFGTCGRAVYQTQIPDLQACADYSICDLCPGGENPCEL